MKIFLNTYATGGFDPGVIHFLINHKVSNVKPIYFYEKDQQEIRILNLPDNNDLEVQDDFLILKHDKHSIFKFERDPKLREKAVQIHGLDCFCCDFNFYDTYGMLGLGYIEVHHTIPLYLKIKKDSEYNPETDMVTVCSNCHKMLHRNKKQVLTPQELREIIQNRKREKQNNI